MALLDANKTRKTLVQKGFVESHGDHHFYLYYHEGKLITKTKMSHNNQDVGDSLISKMYKQCKMDNKGQFLDLINCHLSGEGYRDLLKDKGLLD